MHGKEELTIRYNAFIYFYLWDIYGALPQERLGAAYRNDISWNMWKFKMNNWLTVFQETEMHNSLNTYIGIHTYMKEPVDICYNVMLVL